MTPARSRATEYSWEVDLATNTPHPTLRDPRLPARALGGVSGGAKLSAPKRPRPARRPVGRRR